MVDVRRPFFWVICVRGVASFHIRCTEGTKPALACLKLLTTGQEERSYQARLRVATSPALDSLYGIFVSDLEGTTISNLTTVSQRMYLFKGTQKSVLGLQKLTELRESVE